MANLIEKKIHKGAHFYPLLLLPLWILGGLDYSLLGHFFFGHIYFVVVTLPSVGQYLEQKKVRFSFLWLAWNCDKFLCRQFPPQTSLFTGNFVRTLPPTLMALALSLLMGGDNSWPATWLGAGVFGLIVFPMVTQERSLSKDP